MIEVEIDKKIHKCKYCNCSYDKLQQLTEHEEQIHKLEKYV